MEKNDSSINGREIPPSAPLPLALHPCYKNSKSPSKPYHYQPNTDDHLLKRKLLSSGVTPTPRILHTLHKKQALKFLHRSKSLAQSPVEIFDFDLGCKTLLKLAMARILLLRNEREVQVKQKRRELGQEQTARIHLTMDGGSSKAPESSYACARSGSPSHLQITIMAKDALALLDRLGWKKAHVFGHSIVIAPDQLLSLALLNATGGGFECFPKIDRQMVSLAYRFIRAKTPEQRVAVDLETHYTKYLGKAHLWLEAIQWDSMYQTDAAYILKANDDLDTCNFDKYEETLYSKDKKFVGFTHKKFIIVNNHGLHEIAELAKKKALVPSVKSLFGRTSR